MNRYLQHSIDMHKLCSLENSTCPKNNECINGTCTCSKCFTGVQCDIHFSESGVSLINLMLADSFTSQVIYLILFILISIIGLLSNSLALITFIRERIRITVCGVYLIVCCSCNFILMIFIGLYVLILLHYDNISYSEFDCHIQFYICLTLNYVYIWGSVAIVMEKVLIECFNFSLYEPRSRPIITSMIIIIFVGTSIIPEKYLRGFIEISPKQRVCGYDPNSNTLWYRMHIAISYIHIVLPCLIHLICMASILTTIARRKIFIAIDMFPQQCLYRVWFRQLYRHRDFLIPPLFIIICILPHTSVHYMLISKCSNLLDINPVRWHIALVLLLNVPQMLTFLLYVYPNEIYLKEFMQTPIYRIVCPSSYRRQIEDQRRTRTSSAASLNTIIDDEL